jgi:hypothetical protein
LGGKGAGAVVGCIIGESMAGAQASAELFFNDRGELAGEVVSEGPLVLVGGAGVGEGCFAFPCGELAQRVAGVAVFGDGGSAMEFGGEGGEMSSAGQRIVGEISIKSSRVGNGAGAGVGAGVVPGEAKKKEDVTISIIVLSTSFIVLRPSGKDTNHA